LAASACIEKGFWMKLNPFIQHAVMSDDVGRVAGHEQALEIRIKRQQVFGQVPAVHLGHDHVGHEQVDLAGMLPRQTDRLTRRGGSHHRVSLAFEHRLGDIQDHGLVFHQRMVS
jgi:hypothetical protein